VFRENLKVGLPGEVNYSITTTNGTEADPPVFFGRVVPMVGMFAVIVFCLKNRKRKVEPLKDCVNSFAMNHVQ